MCVLCGGDTSEWRRRGLCQPCYAKHYRAGTLDEVALPAQKGRSAHGERAVGDRWLDVGGYVRVKTADGVFAEHRMVMEYALGRALVRGESIHHRNGERTDNRVENLELWWTPQHHGQRVEELLEYVVSVHGDRLHSMLDAAQAVTQSTETNE